MNTEFWRNIKSDHRGFFYWALILAVVIAAAIFLFASRGSQRESARAEATVTAGLVQSATATAEARSQAATATAEALTPAAGE